MEISTRQLRAFRLAAQHHNFARAAEALFITAYSTQSGQRFQTIVDSAGESAATAADSSGLSMMSCWYEDFLVVAAAAFRVGV